MRIKWILSAAVVATSVIFSFVGTASAGNWYFTCNDDGYIHVNGPGWTCQTNTKCGPTAKLPMGDGFEIIFSEKTKVSPTGQAFLKRLEKEGTAMVKRAPVEGAPPKIKGRPEAIYLRPADVGTVLGALLTKIDPNWKAESSPQDKK